MGTRKARSEDETREELRYIQRTASAKSFGNFRNSVECFGEYVAMQAKFADADGFHGMAAAMRHAAKFAEVAA